MSEKSLRAKAIPVVRLGVRGSPDFAETTGDDRDGTPHQIGPKEGNRVYDAVCLAAQNGNSGLYGKKSALPGLCGNRRTTSWAALE